MKLRRNVLFIILCLTLVLSACVSKQGIVPGDTPPEPEVVEEPKQPDSHPAASNAQQSITVIFPKHEAEWSDIYEPLVKQFEEKTGIRVQLIQSDWDSTADQIIPEMASGGSAYDVVEFDNGWVNQWCGAGWTTPLNEFMPENFTDGMIPGLVDLFTCPDGTLHGVVWNNDTRFFYYNAAKLEEAGFDAPPATWEDFMTQSQKAIEAGVVKHGLDPFWIQEWALMNEFHFWTYAFGGEVVDKQGCILFNKDPKTLEGIEYTIELLKSGVANPAALTYDQATTQSLFLSGNSLFLPQGISGLVAFANDSSLSNVVGDVKIGLVPGIGKSLTLPEAFAIPAASKNKEAAWKFIEFMTSREANIEVAKAIGLLPIWNDLFTHPDLVSIYPYWADFYAQLDSVRGLSTLSWYGDFVDVGRIEFHKALAGEQTAQEALDNMANALEEFNCTP